jgi:dimethylhistidine N-methyltransferase
MTIVRSLHADNQIRMEHRRNIFAEDVKAGLSAENKYIPAVYHYDAEGSRLFDRITELPEYYLTRCEIDALKSNKDDIAGSMDDCPTNVIEFGPGDGSKTRYLVDYLFKCNLDFRYTAIDISAAALKQLADDYRNGFPDLDIDCLAADYFAGMKWLNGRYKHRNLVLFLGSSIGNFSPKEARSFLIQLRKNLNTGDLVLIGFDLVKDPGLIQDAYNDSSEVTAAFNLNVLNHVNRELDGHFDLENFRYEGIYEEDKLVVQSFLISQQDQKVPIGVLERAFHFSSGESIHTEDSHKFRELDIEKLAEQTGFAVKGHLYDSKGYFVDSLWEAKT